MNEKRFLRLKKKSLAQLKKILWEYFAKFIKERDNYICFTCGRKVEGQAAHCGHFIPKKVCGPLLYFSEINNNCQCFNCNINLSGYGSMYSRKMIEKYGKVMIDELWEIKNSSQKWDKLILIGLIKKYERLHTGI